MTLLVVFVWLWVTCGIICAAGRLATWRVKYPPRTEYAAQSALRERLTFCLLLGPIDLPTAVCDTRWFADGFTLDNRPIPGRDD